MRFFFARHGETDWNLAKKVQGTTNTALNANGIRQAQALCESLKEQKTDIFCIYSSYQDRALTTAQIVGRGLQVPVKVVDGLEEMNLGLFEGHTWDEIRELYPDELNYWESVKRYHKTPEGESYQEVLERVFHALNEIRQEAEQAEACDRDVLVLTHGAVIMTIMALDRDIPLELAYTIDVDNAKAIAYDEDRLWEIEKKVYCREK